MEPGDRVEFVGLFPTMDETTGEILEWQPGPYVRVRWDSNKVGILHRSQVRLIE